MTMGDLPLPIATATRLILKPDDKERLTDVRETDARTGAARGLAEYLGRQSIEMAGGRVFQFRKAYSTWAEPEDSAQYPSCIVQPEGRSTYEASQMQPNITKDMRVGTTNKYLVKTTELALTLMVGIWANDPAERAALVAMCEDALNPVDWMYGVRLEFPHYFNARGTFEMVEMDYEDNDESATRRYRIANMTVKAVVPVYRILPFAEAQPRFQSVTDGSP